MEGTRYYYLFFGKETEVAFKRTMRVEVNFGSGSCDKMYHRENNKWMQAHPIPLKVKVGQCEIA